MNQNAALLEARACPVCQGTHCEVLYSHRFSQLPGVALTGFTQQIGGCRTCGAIYVPEFLTDAALGQYYSAMSSYEYSQSGYEYPEPHRRRSAQQFAFVSRFVDRPAACPVLDIGCSLGYTLSLFKTAGHPVQGIEPSERLAQRASAQGIPVSAGFISESTELPPGQGLVILSHVLEHLKNPLGILKRIRGAMAPDGLLFIEVPAIELFDEQDLFQFFFEHVNYFSLGSLGNLMHLAGFEAVEHVVFQNDDGTAPFCPTLATLWRPSDRRHPLIDRQARDFAVLRKYAALVERSQQVIQAKIADLLAEGAQIGIWGGGTLTAQLLAQTDLRHQLDRVAAVFDNDPKKHGERIEGIRILHPDATEAQALLASALPVVIGSWSSHSEIKEQLGRLGVADERIHCIYR
ncbi:MAG TPA: methyltransferase domain-containing protein [Burkholderiaceae bacterium]|nr:methyltransferase domain-containing protein [Burkholderiaceae bacterium]